MDHRHNPSRDPCGSSAIDESSLHVETKSVQTTTTDHAKSENDIRVFWKTARDKTWYQTWIQESGVQRSKTLRSIDRSNAVRCETDPISRKNLDFIYFFSKSRDELRAHAPTMIQSIMDSGMIWISWPKKSSKVATHITEDTVREELLPLGLVDIKVCAVDDTWSGLKMVIRTENRKKKHNRH